MSESSLDEIVNQRLAARVPVLSVVAVATALVWLALVGVTGEVSLVAVVGLLAFQIAVFTTAVLLVRADSNARWARLTAVSASVLNVHSWMVFFTLEDLSSVLHVFVLLAILVYSPLVVPWGWRAEAALLAFSFAFYPVVLPYLHVQLPPDERFVVFAAGVMIALAAAKWFTDVFRGEIRRQIEEEAMRRELVASRDAYRDLAETAQDQIWTADLEGRLTYVNDAFTRTFGSAESLIGSPIDELLTDHPENPNFRSIVKTREWDRNIPPVVVQIRSITGPRWIEALLAPIVGPDDEMVGVRGIGRDITVRRQVEEALRASEERLRALAQRQASVREQERKRLSFDLHDDVCQELVGVGMLVESARRRLQAVPGDVLADLGRGVHYINRLAEHLRGLAGELRPMMLYELGLEQSLSALAAGMSSADTRITVHCPTPIPRMGEDAALAVYRVVQEALLNAVRHASATTVTVTLLSLDGRVSLRVHDDGRGFDVRNAGEGIGLLSMEERALALGGRFDVRSGPAEGTTVSLDFPLAAAWSI